MKAIDIYTIKSAYISWGPEKVKATSFKKYYVYYYLQNKLTMSSAPTGMLVDWLSGGYWVPGSYKGEDYSYKDWGRVSFHKDLEYSHTIPLGFTPIKDSNAYRITYFSLNWIGTKDDDGYPKEFCSDDLGDLYQHSIEVSLDEIIFIEYIQ